MTLGTSWVAVLVLALAGACSSVESRDGASSPAAPADPPPSPAEPAPGPPADSPPAVPSAPSDPAAAPVGQPAAPADPAPLAPAPSDPPRDPVLAPLDIPAEIAIQDTYQRESRAVEQLTRLDAILARDPNQAAAHYLRGRLLGNLKQLPEAKAAFDRALALDPTLAWAHHGIGIFHDKMGDHAAAIVALERAHELAPTQAQFACDLAVEYFQVVPPRHDEALALIAKAIALAPTRGDLHVFRGEMLDVVKQPAEASAAYRRAIDVDPRCFVAYGKLAASQLRAGDEEGAVRTYRELVPVLDSPVERANARRRIELLEGLLASKRLATIDQATSSAELAKELRSDDVDVRQRAHQRLAQWGRATDLPQLYTGLNDEDNVVRKACVNGLARTGLPQTVPWLVKVLRLDIALDVRGQAAEALASVGTRDIIPDLIPLLRVEEHDHVLQMIEKALRKLSGATVDVTIDPTNVATSRAAVADAWERWWKEHREAGGK